MTKKTGLMIRWSVVSVLLLAASVIAAALVAMRPGSVSEGPVRGLTNTLARKIPADAPHLRFTDVTKAWGVDDVHFDGKRTRVLPEDMGSGVCLADLDGDGDLDLVLVGSGPLGHGGRTQVYENVGGGHFVNRTKGSGLDYDGVGMGIAAGDYNGDGLLDLYITGYGKNALFRNDGHFHFTNVTKQAGVAGSGFSSGATWADLDGDGDLDLYVCRYVGFVPGNGGSPDQGATRGGYSLPFTLNPSSYPPETNLLYENLGNGKFKECAKAAGVADPAGRSLGAFAADLDGDGHMDLYVANDVSDNAMFQGLGGMKFKNVADESATADYRGAMGLAVGDVTGDGELDFYVTHWLAEENGLYVNLTKELSSPTAKTVGVSPGSLPTRLFFNDQGTPLGLGEPALDMVGWGTAMADFDLDGRRDIVVTNGSTFEEPKDVEKLVPQRTQIFWNAGGRKGFVNLAPRAGPALARKYVGRGLAVGDIDGDGDPDIVITQQSGPPVILRNDQKTGHHSLTIEVRCPGMNRFGVGSTVRIDVGGKKTAGVIGASVGYLSSGPLRLLFGLGNAKKADQVTVRFPDGTTKSYRDVPAGRFVCRER